MVLPIVFTFLLGGFPAGLVIYWAWNNTLSIGQQWLIMRQMGITASGEAINEEPPKAPPRGNRKKKADKDGEGRGDGDSGDDGDNGDKPAPPPKPNAKAKSKGKTRRQRKRR